MQRTFVQNRELKCHYLHETDYIVEQMGATAYVEVVSLLWIVSAVSVLTKPIRNMAIVAPILYIAAVDIRDCLAHGRVWEQTPKDLR